MNITTPEAKAKLTKAIRSYLEAKRMEEQAKATKNEAATEILAALAGEKNTTWTTDDNSVYQLTATYGKTRKSLSADLIASVLGVQVTPECYAQSKPWDELRIAIKY